MCNNGEQDVAQEKHYYYSMFVIFCQKMQHMNLVYALSEQSIFLHGTPRAAFEYVMYMCQN
jgi:hypothetical protein